MLTIYSDGFDEILNTDIRALINKEEMFLKTMTKYHDV